MSYGYEPQDDPQAGSWREALIIMRAVFAVLAPPLALFFGAIALLMATLFALLSNPPLALIPVGVIVAGLVYIIRRDKRIQAERQAAIEAGRPDPYA